MEAVARANRHCSRRAAPKREGCGGAAGARERGPVGIGEEAVCRPVTAGSGLSVAVWVAVRRGFE